MSSTPHDALFKTTFSHPERAMDLLRVAHSDELVKNVEIGSMRLLSGTYVDDELRSTHSDLLFAVEFDGQEALVYFLFEHQSTNDRLMTFRLQQYMSKIWSRWTIEHPDDEFPPVILPSIVSHAPEGWRSPVRFAELHGLTSERRERYGVRLLDFEVTVLDLVRWSDASIRRAPIHPVSKLVFLALKYGRMARRFRSRVRPWLELLKQALASPGVRDEVGVALRYLLLVGLERKDGLIEAAREARLGQEVEEAIVTDGERLMEEGRLKGLVQGRVEGLERGLERGLQSQRAMLSRMLTQRFGPLPPFVAERLESASPELLEQVSDRILVAQTLDELFKD